MGSDLEEKAGGKAHKYWNNEDNVWEELDCAISKLGGRFPRAKDLLVMGKSSLVNAAGKYGKLSGMRKKMGYELNKRPSGYWNNEDNVWEELDCAISKLGGRFPSVRDLSDMGRSSLANATIKYGRLNGMRKKMGYEIGRKPKGYWNNEDNVWEELNCVISKLGGRFPNNDEMKKLANSTLENAIRKHGKINEIKKNMGYEPSKKPMGYWNNEDIVWEELNCAISKLGSFPSIRNLNDMGKSTLVNAARKYGKLSGMREKMGYEPSKKPMGYWNNEDNVWEELNCAISKLGSFPLQQELNDMKKSGLLKTIDKFGGLDGMRKKMGYESGVKPQGYWNNEDNVWEELNCVVSKLKGRFPDVKELKDMGKDSVVRAARKYGNINKIREKMGYEPGIRPQGYWNNEDNVWEELNCAISKVKHFPLQQELHDMGKSGLSRVIRKNGEFGGVKEKMGYVFEIVDEKYVDNLAKKVFDDDSIRIIYNLAKNSGINRDLTFCLSEIVCANNPELLTRRMQVSGKLGEYFSGVGTGGGIPYNPENAISALEDLFRAKGILANPPRDSLEPLVEIVRSTYDKKYEGEGVVMSEIIGRDMRKVELAGVRDILDEVRKDYEFDERMDREVYGKKIHATVKRPVLKR